MKNYLVGFAIAVIGALILYFFYIVPEREKIQERIDAAYNKGYEDCYLNIDTVFLPSDTVFVTKYKAIDKEKPAEVVSEDNKVKYVASSIDTTIVSGEDEINMKATVGINVLSKAAQWFLEVEHKKLECIPDTLLVKVPKYIEKVEKETNWVHIIIAFLTGNLIMLLGLL